MIWRTLALAALLALTPAVQANDAKLQAIIDAHWAWSLEQYPEYRREFGDDSGNRIWTDQSMAAHAKRDEQRAAFIRDLEIIEPATLSASKQLNRAMLLRELRDERSDYRNGLHLMSISMRSGPQHRHQMAERLPFRTELDYRDWLARLSRLPEQLTQYQSLLEAGIERDRVQAAIVMTRVPDQIQRVVQPAEQSPFFKPFASIPDSIDPETAAALQAEAKALINDVLNPAYEAFGEFMETEYLPACREQPGIGSLEGGKAVYAQLAQHYTTTDMSPEQIHEIGLAEVARIRGEMEDIIEEVGFEGDIAAFNEYLRTDPQFYYETPEALLEAYQAVSKRLDPELVKLFGKLPRMPYGVRPIPAEIAPDTTTAYYMRPAADGSRPGWYYVNLYRPEVRPKYEIEVLSVHESVPGHHLQIALAQELDDLPQFRRNSSVTAFIEGWGLYSERLGYDMGLYQDPYSRYGQKIYDMWRAVRLVVDTGIHYFGWSRERAIEYFKANAAKSEADIINEIDRYIGWPGQALAYKVGQLKMLELRERAEAALGERFDIRAFHDELLGAGAIPLADLEVRMDRWISAQR
ncbi:MAG: DUF885 domain-containing protein [Halieaceae bacterium]|jgi:prolyl oligopeptidase|nr:DUF885 domain-containing protein [Halieaceae bacterium]